MADGNELAPRNRSPLTRSVVDGRLAQPSVLDQSRRVLGREWIGLGELEPLLSEPLQFDVRVRIVERDRVRERVDRYTRPRREVGVQVTLELVDEDDDLGRAREDLVQMRKLDVE